MRLLGIVYQAEVHDGAGRSDFAVFPGSMGVLSLTVKPVIFDLLCTCDLLGVMQALEVVFLGEDAVRGCVGGRIAFLEFLPEREASRSTTLEAESGSHCKLLCQSQARCSHDGIDRVRIRPLEEQCDRSMCDGDGILYDADHDRRG